ncbi:MAG: NAD(+) synthase [Gammaproteobacteria bacterium]|nr:NAD(+) synthase [Gammaproteobacteria bacterium]
MRCSVSETLLDLDCEATVQAISAQLKETIVRFRRRGAVVAVSGGVDSAVCLALAAHAIGPERVLALLLPERESSPDSERLAREVIAVLGVPYERHDITAALEGLGCYRARDEAICHLIPEYTTGWRNNLVITGGLSGQFNHFHLVAAGPDGRRVQCRLGLREYLQIVAATNFKQRTRKAMEYYHADRLNYVVIGTPNRLEYDQGFFVKNGDGAADIKPIAQLYKTQVYALARYMQLPDEIVASTPTSDTYSLPQEQESFYFALPYQHLDVALWHVENGRAPGELADVLGIDEEAAVRIYADIAAKRRTTRYLHEPPVLLAAGG